MTEVRITTKEQPGGRTGCNVTVTAHMGCLPMTFTMPYEPGLTDPHRMAVEAMVQRLRSNRHRVFGRHECVEIQATPGMPDGSYLARSAT